MFFRTYRSTENKLVGTPTGSTIALNDASSALAAGVGFGTMHLVVVFGSVVGNTWGEATYYKDVCPEMNLFLMLCEYTVIA